MASPRVPFKTYRIQNLPSSVTRESLLKSLNLSDLENRILISCSQSTGPEPNGQTVTLTIPEDSGYDFPPTSPFSVGGSFCSLDTTFEGFTPLCSAPTNESFIEYTFSLITQGIAIDFCHSVLLPLLA